MTYYRISPEVSEAFAQKKPIVALETTVVTHGLPYPQNINLAVDMESEIRKHGAVPAAIGILTGFVRVGMDRDQLEALVADKPLHKISRRNYAPVLAKGESGGTTVAGTLIAAHNVGIQVFATGGIGGVHREPAYDISADLPELAQRPVIVVCAGAKAILDLPATVEVLETMGVPVVGYQTDELPAFYSRSSGLPVSARADSPDEVAAIAKAHWGMGLNSAILVTVPPPEDAALPTDLVNAAIEQALDEASEKGLRGQEVTPFLLSQVSQLTGQKSLRTNLSLLLNNARVAAQIAAAMMNPH
ncbi:MAG: pseudouridine-5'-phosphate glycosidase [Chloroflexota bacterium]